MADVTFLFCHIGTDYYADSVDNEHHRKIRVNRRARFNSDSSPSGIRHGRYISYIGVEKKMLDPIGSLRTLPAAED